MKMFHAFILLLVVEALYNCHAFFPSGLVYSYVMDGYQYCKIDMSGFDPRKFQRCCINMAFAVTFGWTMWKLARPIFAVICGFWFTLQAAEVYLTGGFFKTDRADWIIFIMLMVTWLLLERFRTQIMALKVVQTVLNVVHRAWNPKP